MSKQTKKGYLWRSPISNGQYEYFVVKDSMCIDEETEFYYCAYAPVEGGIDAWGINPSPAPFTNFNVLEENLEIKKVDYNKPTEKYIEVEEGEPGYAILSTNLTCADLENTGETYTLIYHDSEGVLKGDLMFRYNEGSTIYWGNNDIDICLHVFCDDGAIVADYLC